MLAVFFQGLGLRLTFFGSFDSQLRVCHIAERD